MATTSFAAKRIRAEKLLAVGLPVGPRWAQKARAFLDGYRLGQKTRA